MYAVLKHVNKKQRSQQHTLNSLKTLQKWVFWPKVVNLYQKWVPNPTGRGIFRGGGVINFDPVMDRRSKQWRSRILNSVSYLDWTGTCS